MSWLNLWLILRAVTANFTVKMALLYGIFYRIFSLFSVRVAEP
jgi:hypothetical protein